MNVSDKGIVALVSHEGIVPGPYLDSENVWTYGVGHTAAAGPPNPAKMLRGTPRNLDAALEEVMVVFRRDLANYTEAVLDAVTVELEQHELDALVSFHYNTGAVKRANLTKRLNAGDRVGAAAGFMSWVKPTSIRERRLAEKRLFQDGVYPEASATVWNVAMNGKIIWKPAKRLKPIELLALLRMSNVPDVTPKNKGAADESA